jgi:hypothetical protein
MRRLLLTLAIAVVVASTAVFAAMTVGASKPADCCGVGNPDACQLDPAFKGCDAQHPCAGDYPVCCPAGGFCTIITIQ